LTDFADNGLDAFFINGTNFVHHHLTFFVDVSLIVGLYRQPDNGLMNDIRS